MSSFIIETWDGEPFSPAKGHVDIYNVIREPYEVIILKTGQTFNGLAPKASAGVIRGTDSARGPHFPHRLNPSTALADQRLPDRRSSPGWGMATLRADG